jgi:hypothetical protein
VGLDELGLGDAADRAPLVEELGIGEPDAGVVLTGD